MRSSCRVTLFMALYDKRKRWLPISFIRTLRKRTAHKSSDSDRRRRRRDDKTSSYRHGQSTPSCVGEKNSNGYRLLQLSRPIQFLRGPILANFSSTICAPESLRCPISSHSFTLCPHFCQKALCLRNSNFTWIGRGPTRDQWQIEWTRGTKKASPVRKFGPHPLQDKLIHLHFFSTRRLHCPHQSPALFVSLVFSPGCFMVTSWPVCPYWAIYSTHPTVFRNNDSAGTCYTLQPF